MAFQQTLQWLPVIGVTLHLARHSQPDKMSCIHGSVRLGHTEHFLVFLREMLEFLSVVAPRTDHSIELHG